MIANRKRSKQDAELENANLLRRLEIATPLTAYDKDRNPSFYAQLRERYHGGRRLQAPDSPLDETNDEPSEPQHAVSNEKKHQPLQTTMLPLPLVFPFSRKEEPLPSFILNDHLKLLESHMIHWKQVRRHWIRHRQLYRQQFKSGLEFVESNRILPADDKPTYSIT